MSCAIPLSADPIRKITIEVMKAPLRPYMSPTLPQMGVEAAVARVYAVTTHDRRSSPPSSPTIVGIAVPTIMLSSMASIIATISANRTTRTLRGCFSGSATTPVLSAIVPTPLGTAAVPGYLLADRQVDYTREIRPATSRSSSKFRRALPAGRQVGFQGSARTTRMGGTMDGTKRQRRGDTRQRIQDVALELFSEQGYEKTSLREIAEHLDVTKAALYYHFKTKEEILISLFQDLTRPLDELIEWGRQQPHTLDTKKEVLRQYSEALSGAAPLFRFMQENQATVRELSIGETFKDRMHSMLDIIREPDSPLTDQVRCVSALFTMHAGMFVLRDVEGDPEDKRKAVLEVAIDLVTQAHGA